MSAFTYHRTLHLKMCHLFQCNWWKDLLKKGDINALFSSISSDAVSIPSVPGTDNEATTVDPTVNLSHTEIIQMDRDAYKIGKKLKYGNNLMKLLKQK